MVGTMKQEVKTDDQGQEDNNIIEKYKFKRKQAQRKRRIILRF